MGARYRLDDVGFREHLLNADFMVEHMRGIAERAKGIAEETAPVYEKGSHPGRYKEAFGEVTAGKNGGVHDDRAWAEIHNDAPEALSVEFGTRNNPARRTMNDAMEKAAVE